MTRTQKEGLTAHVPRRTELSLVEALYVDDSLQVQKAFLNELAKNYDTGVHREDFANMPELARIHINDWVADQTREQITDLLPPGKSLS